VTIRSPRRSPVNCTTSWRTRTSTSCPAAVGRDGHA
jgi:hypothetical protein